MTRTLPLSEAKTHFSRLIADVARRSDEIVITRNGKRAAVIMSAEEYDSWRETQEIKKDPELVQEILEGLRQFEKGKIKRFKNLDDLFGEKIK